MRIRLRISKRGAEIGMLVPIILTLAIAVITIGVGGKIMEATEEKDYGNSLCRAALANQDSLFNGSVEQSLKKMTAETSGLVTGYYSAKLAGTLITFVAQIFAGGGAAVKAGAEIKYAGAVKGVLKLNPDDVFMAKNTMEKAYEGKKVVDTAVSVNRITKTVTASKPMVVNDLKVTLNTGETLVYAVAKDGSPIFHIIGPNQIRTLTEYGTTVKTLTDKDTILGAKQAARWFRGATVMQKWGKFGKTWVAPGGKITAGIIAYYYTYGEMEQAIEKAEATAQSGLVQACGLYVKDTIKGSAKEMAEEAARFTAYACDMGQFEEKTTSTMVRLAGGMMPNDTAITFEDIRAIYAGDEKAYYDSNPLDKEYMSSCRIIWRVGGTPLHCSEIGATTVTEQDENDMSTGAKLEANVPTTLKFSYCHRKRFLFGTEHFVEIEDYREE